MTDPKKESPSIPPDNENVEEGKKAIKAEELSNPEPASEKDKKQQEDVENWRNEG